MRSLSSPRAPLLLPPIDAPVNTHDASFGALAALSPRAISSPVAPVTHSLSSTDPTRAASSSLHMGSVDASPSRHDTVLSTLMDISGPPSLPSSALAPPVSAAKGRSKTKTPTFPSRPRSSRISERNEAEFAKLRESAAQKGSVSNEHSSNDLSPFLEMPLKPGADDRGYVDDAPRRGMQNEITAKRVRANSLSDLGLPSDALALREAAHEKGKDMHTVSTRKADDGYRTGQDVTYTENTGATHDARKPADTPEPRSPNPYTTNEQLSDDGRYERAHQGAFRFSGQPGSTVHAPTQANQVIDTEMERFAAERTGGFTFRRDTYTASSMYAVQPTADGAWEMQQASYMRRRAPPAAPPVTGATSSTSSDLVKK
jgi:hypothetical protein